jgi:transposase InsO family protein
LRKQPESPYNISQIIRALGIARGSYYRESLLAEKDKKLSVAIEEIYKDDDDTLGHKKLAPLVGAGKNRVLRVMKKYAIMPRKRKNKYNYPGKADKTFENLANDEQIKLSGVTILFSDIFEFKLSDGTKVRGCFALKKETRQILSLLFDYSMRADLVVAVIQRIDFIDLNSIWHSDQGKQYGAEITITALFEKGFTASMSRAGTPTDNPFAERFVGTFKHSVVQRRKYETLGAFLQSARNWINFYNNKRPHESLGQISPNEFAKKNGMKVVLYLTNLSVY